MKFQLVVAVATASTLFLSGCSGPDVSSAPTEPSPPATQTSEAIEVESLPAIDDVVAAFLTPADVSPLAVSGTPKAEAFTVGFFGDIPNSEACSESNLESFGVVSSLEPLASQIISVEQELPAYIIQWAFYAGSVEEADSLVQQFDDKFLTANCYESMGKEFTEKIDLDGAIPEGLSGFAWIDLKTLSGDVYSQTRLVSSVGKIVYFSYTVANDNPDSAILTQDLNKISGSAIGRFLQGF